MDCFEGRDTVVVGGRSPGKATKSVTLLWDVCHLRIIGTILTRMNIARLRALRVADGAMMADGRLQ